MIATDKLYFIVFFQINKKKKHVLLTILAKSAFETHMFVHII